MTKEQEKAYKAEESFKNFIKSKESEQNTLYENEEFYRDDIEQNELFLKMLHTVLNLIQKQQEEITKYKYLYEKALSNLVQADKKSLDKDKIIDAILKNYIELTIPTIRKCQNLELKSYLLQQYNNGKFDNILNQTKQYFEKKVDE